MKNSYIFQNKTNLMRMVTLFCIFINLFNVWLARQRSAGFSQLLLQPIHYSMFWFQYMEKKIWPHSDAWLKKWKNVLIVFSDICSYSSLILHQNSPTGSLLKGSCNVESETISIKYSLYSHEKMGMKTLEYQHNQNIRIKLILIFRLLKACQRPHFENHCFRISEERIDEEVHVRTFRL